ncbi:MBOAT family O-acyltransferase [uncultured Imperialibacter sp.]|uniref:MBOAT family O-acyltransferase n=1 Tax=uncultured Imperialibacter sp. TaxID=1672639 RepID=UPI0030D94C3F
MLFNSLEFLIFFPTFFLAYWFVFNKSLKLQNLLIVAGSYLFYGWWDYRFLSLIIFSTIVDYLAGILIGHSQEQRLKKLWLGVSIIVNIGILGFFKYTNFFVNSFVDFAHFLGFQASPHTLQIILPVGISFYTFQTMSYSIDVYRNQLKPTTDFISFAAYVSFFPQLVAGPIERASNLLPQILGKRNFNYQQSVEGLRLILWGLFKKIVIADSLAPVVDDIFLNYSTHSGGTLVVGAVFFAFQIYGDFSGYSDIAIGTSKLFGFELMSNFRFPYFSRDIPEFWRRWHISLSTWFRDYVYIPLGGSKAGKVKAIRNVFVIFLVSGFWHGANWTFIAWGLIHALLFIPSFLMGSNRKYSGQIAGASDPFPSLKETIQIATTFCMVTVGWVFFRSPSIKNAFDYLAHFDLSIPEIPWVRYLFIIVAFVGAEWFLRNDERNLKVPTSRWLRGALYLLIAILIVVYSGTESERDFIYFQF